MSSPIGTGACVEASADGVTLTTELVALSAIGFTPLGQLTSFHYDWRFRIAVAPLNVRYQILGISGSCTLTPQADPVEMGVNFTFDRRDIARDVISVENVQLGPTPISFGGGCGSVLDFFLPVAEDSLRQLVAEITSRSLASPVCRSRDSTTFEVCPTP
jgi:hypothetical protein